MSLNKRHCRLKMETTSNDTIDDVPFDERQQQQLSTLPRRQHNGPSVITTSNQQWRQSFLVHKDQDPTMFESSALSSSAAVAMAKRRLAMGNSNAENRQNYSRRSKDAIDHDDDDILLDNIIVVRHGYDDKEKAGTKSARNNLQADNDNKNLDDDATTILPESACLSTNMSDFFPSSGPSTSGCELLPWSLLSTASPCAAPTPQPSSDPKRQHTTEPRSDEADNSSIPKPIVRRAHSQGTCLSVGPPHLRLFRGSLPDALLPLLPCVIARCEEHAAMTAAAGAVSAPDDERGGPGGWMSSLYTLTNQDLPLSSIPGGMNLTEALTEFVAHCVRMHFGETRAGGRAVLPTVRMDGYSPSVLKYDKNHTGVQLHYDKCDVTVQLLLSCRDDYEGGGTYFPGLDTCGLVPVAGLSAGSTFNESTLVLDRGEILIHPGTLLHSGANITSGTRYVMIWFCHLIY